MAAEVNNDAAVVAPRRQRDVAPYVLTRKPFPVVIGSTSLADVNAEAYARFIGNWGNASGHLGKRWEQVATSWATARRGVLTVGVESPFTLLHVAELDGNDVVHKEVERVGVSCPDALFCGLNEHGVVVLQPVDCKLSLDTASFDQVDGERVLDLARYGGDRTSAAIWEAALGADWEPGDTLAALAAESPRSALQAALETDAITVQSGIFLSPNTPFNKSHLASAENKKRKRPLTRQDVVLVDVAPEDVFGQLPGWQEAQILLEVDGVAARGNLNLGRAEQYYRLGVGVRGVLGLLNTPLFVDKPVEDDAALRKLLAAQQWRSSLALLTQLQVQRAARMTLIERRDKIARLPLGYFAVIDLVGKALGPSSDPAQAKVIASTCLVAARAAHRARVLERGAALIAEGLTEDAALARLEEQQPALRREAGEACERWLRSVGHALPPASDDPA